MKVILAALAALALAVPAAAQCIPPTPRPAPFFVPTADCQGWVPETHPSAPVPPAPLPAAAQTVLAPQGIYAELEVPASVSAGIGITMLAGWAVDCALGNYPPVLRLIEQKPDGSVREVPNDYFYQAGADRPDVQARVGDICPAVYNTPASDGTLMGPNIKFGWSLRLRSPITELGRHVFTAIFSWPAQNHAGSASVVVDVR